MKMFTWIYVWSNNNHNSADLILQAVTDMQFFGLQTLDSRLQTSDCRLQSQLELIWLVLVVVVVVVVVVDVLVVVVVLVKQQQQQQQSLPKS